MAIYSHVLFFFRLTLQQAIAVIGTGVLLFSNFPAVDSQLVDKDDVSDEVDDETHE